MSWKQCVLNKSSELFGADICSNNTAGLNEADQFSEVKLSPTADVEGDKREAASVPDWENMDS